MNYVGELCCQINVLSHWLWLWLWAVIGRHSAVTPPDIQQLTSQHWISLWNRFSSRHLHSGLTLRQFHSRLDTVRTTIPQVRSFILCDRPNARYDGPCDMNISNEVVSQVKWLPFAPEKNICRYVCREIIFGFLTLYGTLYDVGSCQCYRYWLHIIWNMFIIDLIFTTFLLVVWYLYQ